jgi:hypothetical protein
VTVLQPWQQADIGDVTITAAPALHGVYEITFVLRSGADAVYFAGDTKLIPEVREIPRRLLGEKITQLAREVRREPGCLAFTAYQARDTEGRF